MFYYKKFLSLLFILFFLAACANNSISSLEKERVPSWYINPPQNTNLFIYGESVAFTFDDAKYNALNTMASKLMVSVGSSIVSNTQTLNQNDTISYSKNVTKDLKIDVQKIKFTNAILTKSEKIGNRFYVLMKVNRQKLFENKLIKFKLDDSLISKKYDMLQKYTKLEQIYILQKMQPFLEQLKSKAVILNTINPKFKYTSYLEKYELYFQKIEALKNELTIVVNTNNQQEYFKDALINLLNNQYYKVSNSINSDALIYLNNKINYSVFRDWHIVKVSTIITVSINNKVIASKTLNTIGRSSTSKELALKNASQTFLKELKEETLEKIIFHK